MEFDSSKKSSFPTKMIKIQRKETMKIFWILFLYSFEYDACVMTTKPKPIAQYDIQAALLRLIEC